MVISTNYDILDHFYLYCDKKDPAYTMHQYLFNSIFGVFS